MLGASRRVPVQRLVSLASLSLVIAFTRGGEFMPKLDEGALWVDTPTAVNHYRFARQFCGAPTVLGNALSFAMPSTQCTANATALSVIVTTTPSA